jgi:hypothetical protein
LLVAGSADFKVHFLFVCLRTLIETDALNSTSSDFSQFRLPLYLWA